MRFGKNCRNRQKTHTPPLDGCHSNTPPSGRGRKGLRLACPTSGGGPAQQQRLAAADGHHDGLHQGQARPRRGEEGPRRAAGGEAGQHRAAYLHLAVGEAELRLPQREEVDQGVGGDLGGAGVAAEVTRDACDFRFGAFWGPVSWRKSRVMRVAIMFGGCIAAVSKDLGHGHASRRDCLSILHPKSRKGSEKLSCCGIQDLRDRDVAGFWDR